MAQRGIPPVNKCAITPSSTVGLDYEVFLTEIRTPIRTCLDAVGRDSILYIVFTYNSPYKIWDSPTSISGVSATSLDQHIADVWTQTGTSNPYYAHSQSKANIYEPFISFDSYRARAGAGSSAIYSVWRLDARDNDLAKGLVDKAISTETNGLFGKGCFDERLIVSHAVSDSHYGAGEWDIYRAAGFARANGFIVLEDSNLEEFGTSPAPLRCDDAALYAGWYSLNNYNDAFTWNPGAIGFHLDSGSAADPRGGTNWSANAIQRGITVTAGLLTNPSYKAHHTLTEYFMTSLKVPTSGTRCCVTRRG